MQRGAGPGLGGTWRISLISSETKRMPATVIRARLLTSRQKRAVCKVQVGKEKTAITGSSRSVLGRSERNQLTRFQVWPPQNMPPKAQPWTLSRFGPFIAMLE